MQGSIAHGFQVCIMDHSMSQSGGTDTNEKTRLSALGFRFDQSDNILTSSSSSSLLPLHAPLLGQFSCAPPPTHQSI
ncbi:hypothetical protein CBS115989_1717 [Aspergillus niger]|nr:hypothetical protein CBS115989_1717 [Aspergillus niger]KAI2858915.1 hypothetical protein CBS11232_2287 [Aspergillus niger]KAI2871184.1 hypothetical protein CBS115988_8777 [Aspergillus niger]KAI2883392.1 hypothetical protein CBS11852_9197 [Aspergillus niger]KAI2888286.1 hypothetical protein CBS13152_6372 [Aspergillus niger]